MYYPGSFDFWFLVFTFFLFYPVGMGGGQSPPQEAPFLVFGFLIGGVAILFDFFVLCLRGSAL